MNAYRLGFELGLTKVSAESAEDKWKMFAEGGFSGEARAKGELPEFDDKQVEMGQKVEAEHSPHMGTRTKITKDHLVENKKYYTWLEFMEKVSEKYKKADQKQVDALIRRMAKTVDVELED